MGVVNLHGPGVLGGFFVKRQLVEWIPDDIRRQLPEGHKHTWVQPQTAFKRLSDANESAWHSMCRDCLCQLTVTVEDSSGTVNTCADGTWHHFHSTLSTAVDASSDQEAGPEATCSGRARCCKCALAANLELRPPIIEPTMTDALASARRSAHSHHPTQGTRELLCTVSTMFKLVRNACTGNTRPVRLDSDAPRRLLKFDAPCNHILEILGFELTNDTEFHPPGIVRVAEEALDADNPSRAARLAQVRTSLMFRRLERARQELCVWGGQVQRGVPKEERQAVLAYKPAADALATLLGAGGYAQRAGTLTLLVAGGGEHSALDDAYRQLGVPDDAADALVAWSYTRLTEEDQSADPVFGASARARFDSLVTISAARSSDELSALVANEKERGLVATGAIRAACVALFGEPQAEVDAIASDTMREVFLARLAEATAPKAKMELAEHLAVLGDAKQDAALKAYAANVLSTLETSAEIEIGGAAGVAAWKGKVDTWEQLPAGLKNIGNTCYLNSILQCLFSILPIRKAVMSYGDGATWNEGAQLGRRDGGRLLTKDEIGVALKFVELLKRLFEALISQRVEGWAAKKVRKSSGGHPLASNSAAVPPAVAPDRELADMLLLRVNGSGPSNATSTYAPAPGSQQQQQQQDVDECMAQCVGLLVHALPPASLMDSSDQTGDLSGPDDTWIFQLLAGKLELTTERTGPSQDGDSDKPLNEAFLNLNLNIPDETADINDCIDAFFAPSAVAATNDSSQAGPSADAMDIVDSSQLVRRSRLRDAPPVLCIQVQRVQFDMATMRAFKVNSHLRLHERISLTPYRHFDGAAAAHSRRHELQQRLKAVNEHLRMLQVPVQTAANTSDGAPVSVVSALERVQAFMTGVHRWADLDAAQPLLADLPESTAALTQQAAAVSSQVSEMAAALSQARERWEHERTQARSELDAIYADVPDDDMAYTLHAVFIHSGQTPEFGHYWVYIRDYDREKNLVRWLKFNDSNVSVVDASEIFRDAPRPGEESANPYYLMFVRSEDLDATADLGV